MLAPVKLTATSKAVIMTAYRPPVWEEAPPPSKSTLNGTSNWNLLDPNCPYGLVVGFSYGWVARVRFPARAFFIKVVRMQPTHSELMFKF